jgi:hypothetical protein
LALTFRRALSWVGRLGHLGLLLGTGKRSRKKRQLLFSDVKKPVFQPSGALDFRQECNFAEFPGKFVFVKRLFVIAYDEAFLCQKMIHYK